MKNYIPPIEIVRTEMETSLENYVFEAIQRVGVIVDREELMKALAYDRDQYAKGYADASDEVVHAQWHTLADYKYRRIVECTHCNEYIEFSKKHTHIDELQRCPFCGAHMGVTDINIGDKT